MGCKIIGKVSCQVVSQLDMYLMDEEILTMFSVLSSCLRHQICIRVDYKLGHHYNGCVKQHPTYA